MQTSPDDWMGSLEARSRFGLSTGVSVAPRHMHDDGTTVERLERAAGRLGRHSSVSRMAGKPETLA